ncbi:sec1 family domain-containing protein 2-like [Uloborus diversus]|uniref:sec1 family domain-containing protein 2-like n=1 Tax=Uloborus diversus TaxID=327109 RepID=UPI0024090D38|nr:sec1 family domain-containing protein 2-like [Uloborus diversus]
MSAKIFLNRIDLLWTEVTKTVRDAMVVMDDPAAECLHWHGSLKKLLDNGALSVENFTPFIKSESHVKKVVFILMSPLRGETLRTLMIIVRANSFTNCTVISALPERCHSEEPLEPNQNFLNIENSLLTWMGNMNYSAMVYHIPVFPAHLSHDLFLMPSFSVPFSVFNCGLLEMNLRKTSDINIKNLPAKMQANVKQISCCLHSLFDTYQMKTDVFSVGFLSHIVGAELESIAQQQKKKMHPSKASVVIVDRLLDLAGPLSQSNSTMLDQMLKALPHLPGHVFDVCVLMNDLASCQNDLVFGRPLLAPGCIAHTNNAAEMTLLNVILGNNPREAVIEVNRQIVECATKNGINLNLTSKLSVEALKKRILSFKDNPKLIIKFCGLLQQALAVIQALEYSAANPSDKLSATQEALMQYLTASGEEVLSNIMQMILDKDGVTYKMEELMIFIAFIYMLGGNSNISNEPTLQATLMEEFIQDDGHHDLASLFVDGELDDENILDAIKTFFDVLRRLGSLRKGLRKYSKIFKSVNPAFPASYDPLLKQLLQDIFDTNASDIPDIEFHSGSLKDYIKTGFSLFMNVAKPQPRDNPVVFLIILGPITPSEIKLLKDISSKQKGHEIIIGCTGVVTPHDVLEDLGSIVKELSSNNVEETGQD